MARLLDMEGAPSVDVGALERRLRTAVDGEVRFDAGSRGAYSTDSSNYRQLPLGVVLPRTPEDAVAAVAVCRDHGARSCRAAAAPAWPGRPPTPAS